MLITPSMKVNLVHKKHSPPIIKYFLQRYAIPKGVKGFYKRRYFFVFDGMHGKQVFSIFDLDRIFTWHPFEFKVKH